MTGNPCTEYEGYRDYVIATLPQLKTLDGEDITVSERIKALQRYGEIVPDIIRQQKEYLAKWYKTRTDKDFQFESEEEVEEEASDDEFNNLQIIRKTNSNEVEKDTFWSEVKGHSPETRIELAKRKRAQEKAKQQEKPKKKKKTKFFAPDGRPLNINQAKIEFTFDDDYWNSMYTLDVAVYKHLDTELINADVNPFYVRVLIKNKVLQLHLTEEVSPDKSVAKRSQTTGHLVITMPKVKEVIRPHRMVQNVKKEIPKEQNKPQEKKRELLEVEGEFDLRKVLTISNDKDKRSAPFIDNPEVPPLE